ncbi:hypothetical protein ACMDCT_14945 [Halomonadaceae bacterium KBTZ08]
MEERLRRYYLTALGIDPWCARWPLPGAAPSPECPPAASDPADAVKRPDSNSSGEPPRSIADGGSQGVSLEVVREALSSGEEGAASPVVEDSGPTPSDHQAEGIKTAFNAMIWHGQRFSLMAAVTGDFPYESRNRLGRNILKAIQAGPVGEGEALRWPPFENPELPGSEEDAFDRVVDRLARASTSGKWLVLGDVLDEALVPSLQGQGHVVALSARQTLGDLLSDPATKPTLWKRLKPLVEAEKSL